MAEEKVPLWKLAIRDAKEQFISVAEENGNLVNYNQEAYFASNVFEGNDYIQKSKYQTIVNAIVNIATIGLTINPAMKLAYLIPRSEKGVIKTCLDISYMGLVKLATDSGSVLQVASVLVREKDNFTWKGPFDLPLHNCNPFLTESERGLVVGVYTAARLASGHFQVDAMSHEEIAKIRKLSKSEKGPWIDWPDEMTKKTGTKRASKMWPRTPRLAAAEAILNEHEGIDFDAQEQTEAIEGPKAKSEIEGPKSRSEKPKSILDTIADCSTIEELEVAFSVVKGMPASEEKKLAVIAGKTRSKQLAETV